MRRSLQHYGFLARAILVALILTSIIAADAQLQTELTYSSVTAQRSDGVWRILSKLDPTFTRRLSRETKGEIGEENIEAAMRALGRQLDDELAERLLYTRKGALSHGIDGFWHNVTRQRFNAVEAKATSNTGILYESTLGITRVGRQMDSPWIRRSLGDAKELAEAVLVDSASDARQRQMAREILDTLAVIDRRAMRRIDRTLVVTRLNGMQVAPGIGQSVHHNLARHFNHIIEVPNVQLL